MAIVPLAVTTSPRSPSVTAPVNTPETDRCIVGAGDGDGDVLRRTVTCGERQGVVDDVTGIEDLAHSIGRGCRSRHRRRRLTSEPKLPATVVSAKVGLSSPSTSLMAIVPLAVVTSPRLPSVDRTGEYASHDRCIIGTSDGDGDVLGGAVGGGQGDGVVDDVTGVQSFCTRRIDLRCRSTRHRPTSYE